MPDHPLLEPILALHAQIRDSVLEACRRSALEDLAGVSDDAAAGDTIYEIDRVSEDLLVEGLGGIAMDQPLVLIGEGLPEGKITLPIGTPESECRWRVIVDPIDGTRGIMYQKRPAWILTGVAPNLGPDTGLRDVVLAIQTEIPLIKQHLADQVWAVRDQGVSARRIDVLSGAEMPLALQPSRSETIEHGFATVVRFFPGVRDVLAEIDDEIARLILGPPVEGKAACFEDQYACTGGQLYELMTGHDRFIADLRPLMKPVHEARGLPVGLCCHPYDVCTALIAGELGVEITDGSGAPLNVPLDVDFDVSWAGYANRAVRTLVEPVLKQALMRRSLI